ncbi:hypothetical protein A359_05260 [secondary endosymbiont of Ctenarytaina eucalypti]|uniref:Uncharacterized protein n=1 Tax=secondary endosymbiont of Ctenarytaina eucalypti TaxID=1199245 RepID=J3YS23_9ENTR|nr:hypothetical protein A359_05260 [secondary endosymbiont of Ctenarytaina eucalypti]
MHRGFLNNTLLKKKPSRLFAISGTKQYSSALCACTYKLYDAVKLRSLSESYDA